MKKWIFIEVVVLAVLLVVAVVVCAGLAEQAFAPEGTDSAPTETETVSVETTEPAPTWLVLPEEYELTCQQYFVYDCDAGAFVDQSAPETERVYPASITKLFTAYVALQYLPAKTVLTAAEELEMVVWGSSVAELKQGDCLTAEQLVEAMLLPSGNDAAHVLAAAAGRVIAADESLSAATAVDVFMEQMNKQAQQLGMTGTHFVNPDGIHDGEHYMSFADLAKLGKLSMENATVMKYASVGKETVELQEGPVVWENTNALIQPDSKYYCPYAVGLKTGQTPSAGSCLLSAFRTEEQNLIIGVFGCPEVEDRFADTLHLLNKTLGIVAPATY